MKGKIWLCILLFAALASVPFLVPHCGWVALFAFIPLLCFADLCTEGKVRRKGWWVYLAFLLFNTATTFWINWISVPGALFAIGLNSLQMWAIFMLFLWSRKYFKGGLSYLFLITMWIAWERVYQDIEISWPWLILGNSLATSPKLAQWYEYTGFLGGTLWIWLSNIFLYESYRHFGRPGDKYALRQRFALVLISMLTIVVPIAISLVIYKDYKETENPREVVLVQPNIDSYTEKHGGLSQDVQDAGMLALVRGQITDSTDFVITPETYTFQFNLDTPETNVTYNSILELLKEYPNTDFLLGAITYRLFPTKALAPYNASPIGSQWYCAYNTAMMIDTTGIRNFYHKSKLVPAVEIIPYQRYLGFLGKVFELFGGSMSSYGVSDDVNNLTAKDGTKVGAMICYESIYGEYYRRTAKYPATGSTSALPNCGPSRPAATWCTWPTPASAAS